MVGGGAADSAEAQTGAAAATSAAPAAAIFPKKCTGRRPVHSKRKAITRSPNFLPSKPCLDGSGSAALAAPHWSRGRHRRRRRSRDRSPAVTGRRAIIILPVVNISVHYAVIIPVSPDRAGKTTDRSTDHRTLEDADARKDGTGDRDAASADRGVLGDP